MYRIPINFHNRLMRGESPTAYVMIETHMGNRAYAEKELPGVFELTGLLADGTVTADGSEVAGSDSIGVLEKSARVLGFGAFERTLQSKREDVLTAFTSKQIQNISIELDNADSHFSKLIAQEPFLGRPLSVYVGFPDDPQGEHISLFKGAITELSIMPTFTIEAEEA